MSQEEYDTKSDKRRWVLEEIQRDCEADVYRFEGAPFTGKTVAEYMGNQAAAISALARIVATLLPTEWDADQIARAALTPDHPSLPDNECPIPFPGAVVAEWLPAGGWVLRPHTPNVRWDEDPDGPHGCQRSIPRGSWPDYKCSRGAFHGSGWCVANVRYGEAVAVWRTPDVVAAQHPAEAASPLSDRPTIGISEADGGD